MKTDTKMYDNWSMYENVSKMEVHNATFYPTEATILAAVCACIFSVVGVVGKFYFLYACALPIPIVFTDIIVDRQTARATNYSRKALKQSLFIGCHIV